MIYQLVARQNEIEPRPQRSQYLQGERNRLMIAQPGLFKVCRAIRDEGLIYFYQWRELHILIDDGSTSLKALQRWLRRIDAYGRLNIRHLRVTFKERFKELYLIYIEYIIRRLTDQALVVFHAGISWDCRVFRRERRLFKEIRATYAQINSGRIPELQESDSSQWYYPSYGQPYEVGRSRTSLAFLPRPWSPAATPYSTPTKIKSVSCSSVTKVMSRPPVGNREQKCVGCGCPLGEEQER